MASHRHEAIKAAHVSHEGHATTLSSAGEVWTEAERDDTSLEWRAESEEVQQSEPINAEFDNLVARYFGDVRQFALLNRSQEKELWQIIEDAQMRVRRALSLSPVGLSTLTQLWHQIEMEDIALDQITGHVTDENGSQRRAQLGEGLVLLQELASEIRRLRTRRRARSVSSAKRRALRQKTVGVWRTWLETWEALELQASVYDAIRLALQAGVEATPHDPALGVAQAVYTHAHHQLTQAKNQMLRSNLRLVIHVANRYRGRGLPLLDLIQEGNIGLMRGLEKFEHRRGLKFVTYAHWWVRQAISRAITEQHRTVRLPSHVVDRKNKLRAVSERLWDVHGRVPNAEELSAALGWTRKEVEELMLAVQPMTRLHQPVGEGSGMLADILEDTQSPKPDDLLAKEQLQRRMADCLTSLTERKAFILRLRYGLESDHPHTLQEIATILGLSRERVRQLERQALDKLREPHHSTLLVDFVAI